MTEGSRGVTEVWMRLGGCGLRLGRWWTLGTPTPHLASPLKGGRDELGKGWVLGGWVPACAGMTEGGAGMADEGRGGDGGGACVAEAKAGVSRS